MDIGILGISYYLPAKVLTNEELQEENPDWRMDEIHRKCGVSARHIAAEGETAVDLGFVAAERLLARGLVPADEIDYIIFCTETPDHFLPSGACILQHRLGLKRDAGAFDYNLGCSAYVYGLQIARSLILSGSARNVLLITADTYSKIIHPRDRTVRAIFGDGGAATLIGPTRGGGRIGEVVVGTDGTGASSLVVPAGGFRKPRSASTASEYKDAAGCIRSENHLYMDGPAVFTFAISVVPRAVGALFERALIGVSDVEYFVYHQANKYMLQQLRLKNAIPAEKMAIDLEDVGNTVSSSIPITVQRAVDAGRIRAGHRLVLVGFGVGFSWGACELVWDDTSATPMAAPSPPDA